MKKHRLWMVIMGILLFVGCCTAISARNYVEDMPVVTLTDSVSNSLHRQLTVSAGLYYQETEQVQIPAGCQVAEVFVKAGDKVAAGEPLLQLKEADVQIQYLQRKLQKESLEKTMASSGTQGELAYWQLQNLEEELAYMEQLIAAGCAVSVEQDCVVICQEYESGDTAVTNALIEVAFPESGCYLEWKIDRENYLDYKGTAQIGGDQVKLSWEQPEFENGVYTYYSTLTDVKECMHGEPVEVELLYTSAEYRAVLPQSCIWYDADGSAYVYQVYTRTRNFGEESYVMKRGVIVLEEDDMNVAIISPLENVVERKSEKLADMMAVVVVE